MNKYVLLAIIVGVSVISDFVTKRWAEANLASRSSRWEHSIQRTVAPEQANVRLEEWIAHEFGLDADDPSLRNHVHSVFVVESNGDLRGPVGYNLLVAEGMELEIFHRQITVIDGFWNHVYVQNFGAAWGILGDKSEAFRKPFFFGVSIIALLVIGFLFRSLHNSQWLMASGLSFIVGGAVGNLIDRIQYGYVVDFIDWYITWGGEEKHWPTFNIADVAITIGVVLMAFEIIFGKDPNAATEADAAATDTDDPKDGTAAEPSTATAST